MLLRHPPGLSAQQRQALEQAVRQAADLQNSLARECDLIRSIDDLTLGDEGFWVSEVSPEATALESLVAEAPIDPGTVACYGVQLCEALLHACYPESDRPRPHGAIRPLCIFVTGERILISDFGLAEALSQAIAPGAAQEELDLMAPYIARELWLNPGVYGELRDLFAIGVILYELATGRHPFGANRTDFHDCEQRILMGRNQPAVESHPGLDPAFAALLDQAVAKREEQRFGSLRALRDALSPFITVEPTTVESPEAALADQLIRAEALQATQAEQQAALDRLCEPLRAGLYPEARVMTRLERPVPALKATIYCFGGEDGEVCIELPLIWNASQGRWEEHRPGAIEEACVERAAAEIEASLQRTVIEASGLFSAHARFLQFEFDPPALDAGSPHTFQRSADLLFRRPNSGEVHALGKIDVQFPFELSKELARQARRAEKTFEQIVQDRKRQSARTILDELTQAAAPALVRSQPRRLRTLPDLVTFTFGAETHREVLQILWNPEQWCFVQESDWQMKLERFQRREAAEPCPRPHPHSKFRDRLLRALSERRRAVAALGVLVALTAVVVAWIIWPCADSTTSESLALVGNANEASIDSNANSTPLPTYVGIDEEANSNEVEKEVDEEGEDHARWAEELAQLEDRFRLLKSPIDQNDPPTHAVLASFINNSTQELQELAEEIGAFTGELDASQPALPDEFKQAAEQLEGEIEELRQKVSDYRPILSFDEEGLAKRVDLYEKGKTAWNTAHVKTQLEMLNPIHESLKLAAGKSLSDWRSAMFFFKKADQQGAEALKKAESRRAGTEDARAAGTNRLRRRVDLAEMLDREIADMRGRIAEARRNQIEEYATHLEQARDWLDKVGSPPPEPLDHLAKVDECGEARSRLDELDYCYPQDDELVDQQEGHVLKNLLDWTTVSLPLTEEVSIELTFIPENVDRDIRSFWMSQTEITVAQYREIMGQLPTRENSQEVDPQMKRLKDHPVGYVTVRRALEFCTRLSERFENGYNFRLPREGEWNRAFLANYDRGKWLGAIPGLTSFGRESAVPSLDMERVNLESDELAEVDPLVFNPGRRDGFARYAPVRSYLPNRWMLYEMLGNVREWVHPLIGSRPITIGGSFRRLEEQLEQFHPLDVPSDTTIPWDDVGFRIVGVVP